jgi:hypothetical protein
MGYVIKLYEAFRGYGEEKERRQLEFKLLRGMFIFGD